MIYFSVIADPIVDELPPYAGWLYIVIVRHINRKLNQLPMSLSDLAKAAQMSVRSVIRYSHILEEKGLIAVKREQKPGSAVAEINIYSLIGAYANMALGLSHAGTGGSDSGAQGAVTQGHSLDSTKRDTSIEPERELSSMPTHRPDDDDLAYFKTFESRFDQIQASDEPKLRSYRRLLDMDSLRAVMRRCESSNGRAWSYVLTALGNELQQQNRKNEGRDTTKWRFDDNLPLPTSTQPPGYPPVVTPDDNSHEDTTSGDFAEPDEDTKPDSPDKTPPPKPTTLPEIPAEKRLFQEALRFVMQQIPGIEQHIWFAELDGVDGTIWTIRLPREYVVDIMNDPRVQKQVKPLWAQIVKADESALELRFVSRQKAQVAA